VAFFGVVQRGALLTRFAERTGSRRGRSPGRPRKRQLGEQLPFSPMLRVGGMTDDIWRMLAAGSKARKEESSKENGNLIGGCQINLKCSVWRQGLAGGLTGPLVGSGLDSGF